MGEIEDYVSLLAVCIVFSSIASTRQYARKLSGAYLLDFSMFCDSRMRYLQEQGLAIKFGTEAKNIGNSLSGYKRPIGQQLKKGDS